MVSITVREKDALQKQIRGLIAQHEGIRSHVNHVEADNAFWQRKNAFITALRDLGDLSVGLEIIEDYPRGEDRKVFSLDITKISRPSIVCHYRLNVWGPDFFKTFTTELAISGGCSVEQKRNG